jgi:hypothetical protein
MSTKLPETFVRKMSASVATRNRRGMRMPRNNMPRRHRPTTRKGRARRTELFRIIRSARTSRSVREAAVRELDTLSPIVAAGEQNA